MGPALQRAMALLGRQRWLDPFAERAQRSIVGAFKARGEAGQRVKNALHGVWLGHPLHQAITDVPVGAWTTAAVLDLLDTAGGDRFARGADAAIVVGLAGATGAAVSGLTDWSATDGAARRQGIVHGALNGLVSLLYIASLLRRLAGDRAGGRRTAFTAYGIASVSAYIGGHLVAGERVGVDHAPALPEVSDYRPVLAASELAEGQPRRVELDGMPLMLVRRGPRVYTLADQCAHLGGPLSEGRVDDESITCPWHGSRYSLEDGRVLDGPSAFAQPHFDTRLRNGQVEVRSTPSTPSTP